MTSARPVALALLAAALFGAGVPASKVLLAQLSPFQLAGVLYLGAAIGVAPAALLSGGVRLPRAGDRNRLRLFGAIAAGGVCGPLLLLFGLQLAGAASVSLWLSFEVAATALLGVLWFRDRLGLLGVAGVLCAVAGAVLLSAHEGTSGLAAGALVLAACTCWGLDNHLTALIDGITPSQTTFWKGLAAGSVNLAIGLATAPVAAAPVTLVAGIGVGALAYGVSIALLISASQTLGATRAQSAFASAPFFGALFAMLFLGEALGGAHLAAASLFAAGVALLGFDRHAHTHAHAAQEHEHAHRHDDGHHDHLHPGEPRSLRHTHRHSHAPLVHRHLHWPDLHHRHEHEDVKPVSSEASNRVLDDAAAFLPAGYRIVLARREQFAAMREVERAAESIFPPEVFPLALRGQSLTSDAEFAEAERDGLLWCAEGSGGEVAGYAIAFCLGSDLHLDEIDVHPDHQRRGIGRALVDAVCAYARANGAKRVTLTTFRSVPWNMPWYERLGFVAFAENALPHALAEIFEEEISRGLARELRVAMALELAR